MRTNQLISYLPLRFCLLALAFQKTAGLSLQLSDHATTNLQNFVDENGGNRVCEIGPTKYGRGLVASRDLEADDVVLRIPLACAIIEPDHGGDESWTGRLAKRLMLEQGSCYKEALPVPPSTPARGDWPEEILNEFQNPEFENEINDAQNWRYSQWEEHSGSYQDRQEFLDSLDLVCSRTIRVGKELMLVPLLDMANHASRQQGGGYYKRDGDFICLHVGERGVKLGEEVTLDYGNRQNEEWLIHYGFLPDRNTEESVTLPNSNRVVSWNEVGCKDISLERECLELLQRAETTLEEDLELVRGTIDDYRLRFALDYRISRKVLLSAIAGSKAASPSTSAFSAFSFADSI